jgi:translocator protein
MKLNFIIIPLVTVAVAVLGSVFTSSGMSWYRGLTLMPWTPSGRIIGPVWTVLYILATASALIAWNRLPRDNTFTAIMVLFAINAILNLAWSFLFFRLHLMGTAIFECILLGLTLIALIILLWPRSPTAALLLVPYALWVSFATFLNWNIWKLNS